MSPATVRKQHNHTIDSTLLACQQPHTLSSHLFTKRHLTRRTAMTTPLHAIDNSIISNTLHPQDDAIAHLLRNRAQHRPATPLMLHMALSHPPLSTVIEICTFIFEHFHESISFPCSPARFLPPTRFFLFMFHCFIPSIVFKECIQTLQIHFTLFISIDATAMQPQTRFRSQSLLLTSRMHTTNTLHYISSSKHFILPYMAQFHSHTSNAIKNRVF